MWNLVRSVTTLAVGERFEFECFRWEMQLLTWAKYRKSLQTEFERKLAAYEAETAKIGNLRSATKHGRKLVLNE